MNYKEVVKLITKAGWYEVSQKGSHVKFNHPTFTHHVIVPNHGKDDLKAGTLNSILKDAGVKK